MFAAFKRPWLLFLALLLNCGGGIGETELEVLAVIDVNSD